MRPPSAPAVHRKNSRPDPDALIADALAYLGEDEERMDRFLALCGLSICDLRLAASGPGFAESLLDHLCADERLLVAFARDKGYDPASIEALRASLAPPPFEG